MKVSLSIKTTTIKMTQNANSTFESSFSAITSSKIYSKINTMNYRSIFYYFIVTKNLTFLYSCFAVLSPPTKLELILAGKAKKGQWTRPGTYILSDSLVNGFSHWLKTDGSQAIWMGLVLIGN